MFIDLLVSASQNILIYHREQIMYNSVQGSIPFPISYTRVLISSTLDDLCQGMVVSSFKYWLIDNMTHSYLEAIFFSKQRSLSVA